MPDKRMPEQTGENMDGRKDCGGQFACDGCYWCHSGGTIGNREVPGCILSSCRIYQRKPHSVLYEGAPCEFRADPVDPSFSTGLEALAKSIQHRWMPEATLQEPPEAEYYIEPDSEFALDPEEPPYEDPYGLGDYGLAEGPYPETPVVVTSDSRLFEPKEPLKIEDVLYQISDVVNLIRNSRKVQ